MHCPRLDHFVRLNQDGSVGKCGHMVNAKGFESYEELEHSEWMKGIRNTMSRDKWPDECTRCQQSERVKGESIRTNSIVRHKMLHPIRKDYLIVGGVLDNVCNSACQSCNAGLSTKIGSLESKKDFPRVDNYEVFKKLPQERIIEFDVNGGEPTASKNYKKILKTLPDNVKIVRMNTNGSRMISELEDVLKRNIMVIVTMSLDGIGSVHDYTRWPIKWTDYKKTVDAYKKLQGKYKLLQLDFWTTVSCLNIKNLPEIINFAKNKNIPHDWAFLNKPSVLNIRYKNRFTTLAKHMSPKEIAVEEDNSEQLELFIKRQDALRNISVDDYFNLTANFSKNN
jgi:sulfatase maturation enzyme AslB (radical SAM superfamily)|tara:strand:+ start:256 stop:1269 length:1014 start_codon:yes stop_codon:yes gene_type:complete